MEGFMSFEGLAASPHDQNLKKKKKKLFAALFLDVIVRPYF